MTVLIVTGAILAIVICFLFIPMPINIEYRTSLYRMENLLSVSVWGVKVYKSKEKPKKDAEPEDEGGFSRFMGQLSQLSDVYDNIKADITRILEYLKKKINCRLLFVRLDVGLSNAALTGIATGAAYGLIYGFASLIHNIVGIKKMDVEVNPDFNNSRADFNFNSIFSISPAHIIRVLWMVLAIKKNILI